MNMAIGDIVTSDGISAGGHLWRIICYPRGFRQVEKGEYVSLYLELISNSRGVRAIFHAFCLGREGGDASVSDFSHDKRLVNVYSREWPEYPERLRIWGWCQFMQRSVLESVNVADGWVTFLCNIIVLDTVPVPPSSIGYDLGYLLDSNIGADVSFIVKGEAIQAHRAILAARSPVFQAELFGSMDEATTSSITLQEIEPATFKSMLDFIYTDEMPQDDELGGSEMVQHLLAAADRYALDRLKMMCARKLWGIISVDTFASTLACAEMHSCAELKNNCIDFFAAEENFKKIVFTAGFISLVQEFPDLAAKLKERVGI